MPEIALFLWNIKSIYKQLKETKHVDAPNKGPTFQIVFQGAETKQPVDVTPQPVLVEDTQD